MYFQKCIHNTPSLHILRTGIPSGGDIPGLLSQGSCDLGKS